MRVLALAWAVPLPCLMAVEQRCLLLISSPARLTRVISRADTVPEVGAKVYNEPCVTACSSKETSKRARVVIIDSVQLSKTVLRSEDIVYRSDSVVRPG